MVKFELLTRLHTVILRTRLCQTILHLILVPDHYVAARCKDLDILALVFLRACRQAYRIFRPPDMLATCVGLSHSPVRQVDHSLVTGMFQTFLPPLV